MDNSTIFILSTLLAFPSYVFLFYRKIADKKINEIFQESMAKGINIETLEGQAYFNKKCSKWDVGYAMGSPIFNIIGLTLILISIIINSIYNNLVWGVAGIFIGYVLFKVVTNIIGDLVQLISLVTGALSAITIIILVMV